MERNSKKVLIPLFLAAIIVPTTIFLGFNRSSEPHVSREFNANTVEWNFTRPNYSYPKWISIAELVTNSYEDEIASVDFSIFISSYYEEEPTLGDYITFKIILSANLTKGFIYGLQIKFSVTDNAAEELDINQDDHWIETRNLSPPASHDSYRWTEPAYISAKAVGNPSNCYLTMFVNWFFFDKNNINHETTATANLVFYNGSEYMRMLIPIDLAVVIALGESSQVLL